MLGFVAFHIKSRPVRPQKIKEKWKDTQPFPPGTLAIPTSRECGWVLKGRGTRPVEPGMGDAPARSTQALGRSPAPLTARPPSASADHRWAPQGSLGLVTQWLRGAVLIGQSEHHCTRDCVPCTVPVVVWSLSKP